MADTSGISTQNRNSCKLDGSPLCYGFDFNIKIATVAFHSMTRNDLPEKVRTRPIRGRDSCYFWHVSAGIGTRESKVAATTCQAASNLMEIFLR